MRIVFADAGYWIALINARDQLHVEATAASAQLGPRQIVTSEMVLAEALNSLAGFGDYTRSRAARIIQEVIDDGELEVVTQTSDLFRRALALYRDRSYKDWSLTDCASFVIMTERRITEALTHDRHFEQNGYRALLRN